MVHHDTREHLFSHVQVRIKQKLHSHVGIFPSHYTSVHSRWCSAGACFFLVYPSLAIIVRFHALTCISLLLVATDARSQEMLGSMLGKFFTPVMERTVSNTEISVYLNHEFSTFFCNLYCLYFKFSHVLYLHFIHDLDPFGDHPFSPIYLLYFSGSRPTSRHTPS